MKREITALSLHANVCNLILFCKFIGGKKIEWAKAQLKKTISRLSRAWAWAWAWAWACEG